MVIINYGNKTHPSPERGKRAANSADYDAIVGYTGVQREERQDSADLKMAACGAVRVRVQSGNQCGRQSGDERIFRHHPLDLSGTTMGRMNMTGISMRQILILVVMMALGLPGIARAQNKQTDIVERAEWKDKENWGLSLFFHNECTPNGG